MAPEIHSGLKYDHMVDIWSLGCILHFMLFGRNPFSAGSQILKLGEIM